ncbi:hypothetical protein BDY24DRAFT_74883 [Mrakia frigida]|uniref:uncharacterized protein n=1 Tax=Mrakia frigida TaxID=29902 RepID=UPI003FCC16EF
MLRPGVVNGFHVKDGPGLTRYRLSSFALAGYSTFVSRVYPSSRYTPGQAFPPPPETLPDVLYIFVGIQDARESQHSWAQELLSSRKSDRLLRQVEEVWERFLEEEKTFKEEMERLEDEEVGQSVTNVLQTTLRGATQMAEDLRGGIEEAMQKDAIAQIFHGAGSSR